MIRLALLALLSLGAVLPAAAQGEGRMRIVGRGLVEVVPDLVVVRVGVSTKAPTPTAALDQNSGIARKIIDFSKTFGVEERDIQTDAVNLAPAFKNVRDPNGGMRQEPDGYAATNVVRVKLTDLSRLGVYMRQVLDQGATNINGVQFGTSNPDKANDEARSKAVEDAVRQAQRLAEAAKVKLGRIQEIVHPLRSPFNGTLALEDAPVFRAARAVPVEVGTLQVRAEVEITWTIE